MNEQDLYAIIKTGGKQYRVSVNDVIDVELIYEDPKLPIEFNEVLFIGGNAPKMGAPFVVGGKVMGEMVDIVSGPKIKSVKYKPSHNQYRHFGHRQHYSRVKITSIAG